MRNLVMAATLLLVTLNVTAGSYTFADEGFTDTISHPRQYTGEGGDLVVSVCLDANAPVDVIRDAEIELINALERLNERDFSEGKPNHVTTGFPHQLHFGGVLLHEIMHCAFGTHHSNMGTKNFPTKGFPSSQDIVEGHCTNSTKGGNDEYDLDLGVDGLPGTSDDLRGDDITVQLTNLFNEPNQLYLPVDKSTHGFDIVLPPGHFFNQNRNRRNDPNATSTRYEASVMSSGIIPGFKRSALHVDDYWTLRYAESGVDEIAGTEDDYQVTLVYGGRQEDANDGCDVFVQYGDPGIFAVGSCDPGLTLPIAINHVRIGRGIITMSVDDYWWYDVPERLFQDDFESGTLVHWDEVGGASLVP